MTNYSLYSTNFGCTWSNNDKSLELITTNHPITGKYYGYSYSDIINNKRRPGYLDNVDITCTSKKLFEEFLKTFRSYATYKNEANYHKYIFN